MPWHRPAPRHGKQEPFDPPQNAVHQHNPHRALPIWTMPPLPTSPTPTMAIRAQATILPPNPTRKPKRPRRLPRSVPNQSLPPRLYANESRPAHPQNQPPPPSPSRRENPARSRSSSTWNRTRRILHRHTGKPSTRCSPSSAPRSLRLSTRWDARRTDARTDAPMRACALPSRLKKLLRESG